MLRRIFKRNPEKTEEPDELSERLRRIFKRNPEKTEEPDELDLSSFQTEDKLPFIKSSWYRVLLVRDFDATKRRRLLYDSCTFDSTAVMKLPTTMDILGDVLFGSLPMAYKGPITKLHHSGAPLLILLSRMFQVVTESTIGTSSSRPSESPDMPTCSNVDIYRPYRFSFSASLPVILEEPLTTLVECSGQTSHPESGLYYKRRVDRGNTISIRSGLHDRPWKYGGSNSILHSVVVVMELWEGTSESLEKTQSFENFFFSHYSLIRNHLVQLQMEVQNCLGGGGNVLLNIHLVVLNFQKSLKLLTAAPRIQYPMWLSFWCCISERSSLYSSFTKSFLRSVDVCENREHQFLFSCLITAVLTYHLSWVATVSETSEDSSRVYLDKHVCKKMDTISGQHIYNPPWAQLGDLYGLISSPGTLNKVVVVGRQKRVVCDLLQSLSYFLRCGIVEDFQGTQSVDTLLSKYRRGHLFCRRSRVPSCKPGRVSQPDGTLPDGTLSEEASNPNSLITSLQHFPLILNEVRGGCRSSSSSISASSSRYSRERERDDIMYLSQMQLSMKKMPEKTTGDRSSSSGYLSLSQRSLRVPTVMSPNMKTRQRQRGGHLQPHGRQQDNRSTLPDSQPTTSSTALKYRISRSCPTIFEESEDLPSRSNFQMRVPDFRFDIEHHNSDSSLDAPRDCGLGSSIFGGYQEDFSPDMVLQGLPVLNMAVIHSHMMACLKQSCLGECLDEVNFIIADTDRWTCEVVSLSRDPPKRNSETTYTSKTTSSTSSSFVNSMVDSIKVMAEANVPVSACVMHVEDKLREIFSKSQLLHHLIQSQSRPLSKAEISSALGCYDRDLDLLFNVASAWFYKEEPASTEATSR